MQFNYSYSFYKVVLPKLDKQEILIANTELQTLVLAMGGIRLMSTIGPKVSTAVQAMFTPSRDRSEVYSFFKTPDFKYTGNTFPDNCDYVIFPCTENDYKLHITDESLDLEEGTCYSSSELIDNFVKRKKIFLQKYCADNVVSINFKSK